MIERPKIKLRNCPCCGSFAVWSVRKTVTFLSITAPCSDLWRVQCFNCNMRTAWSDSAEFIASEWNRVPKVKAELVFPTDGAERSTTKGQALQSKHQDTLDEQDHH